MPLINIYAYVYVLAYRDEAFPDGPPTTWNVLLDPKFKGRVAIYNDGIGMHFPAVIAGGGTYADIPDNMQPAWDFHQAQGAIRRSSARTPTSPPGSRTARSTSPAPSRPTPARPSNNGIKVDWTVPNEGAKIDTDCLWIPKGLPEGDLYWTKQYINYAISPEGAAGLARRRSACPAWCPA